MSFDTPRLYELLPEIHRVRDAAVGGPLRELLDVIAEQVAVLEEDLDQLLDDQFVETAADWAVPYIGRLIGYRELHGEVPQIASPRAEVAHTIAFRRRKGTAAMLEQLARDVTSWPANVVEYFLRLGTSQYLNHVRPDHAASPNLRAWEPLERLGGPFDDLAHTVDVRAIATRAGRHNIPNVGIFLWRLGACRVSDAPAARLDDRRYRFSPLGHDAPLFTEPAREPRISHLARPRNVPEPISRRVLDAGLDDLYGPGRSLLVRHDGADAEGDRIVAADLSDAGGGTWAHRPTGGVIAVDPVLGRIAFPEDRPPPADVRVTWHYGFAGDLGGGEYDRLRTIETGLLPLASVSAPAAIQPALDGVAAGGGSVQVEDGGRFEETLAIAPGDGRRIELRAANRHRPLVVPGGDLVVTGGAESEVTINGLLIAGGTVRVPAAPDNGLQRLRLRHCTLVPGLALAGDGTPVSPDAPSLVVEQPGVVVELDHCIVGGLRVHEDSRAVVTASIVDATDETRVAYAAPDGEAAGGLLQLVDATVVGLVRTDFLEYASNVISLARLPPGHPWPQAVRSERRQGGCVRFSFLDLSAAVPRRYRCQPDLEIETRIEARERAGSPPSPAERDRVRAEVTASLVPYLTSRRYGDPGYGQLHADGPEQIRAGADDEAGMGAFHELYEPQRETNLRLRLDEYLRFGLEAGIFYAS